MADHFATFVRTALSPPIGRRERLARKSCNENVARRNRAPSSRTSPSNRKPGKSAARTFRARGATSHKKAGRKVTPALHTFTAADALWHTAMPLQMDPTVSTTLLEVSCCCALRAELIPGSMPAVLAASRPGKIRVAASRAASSAIPAALRRRFASGSDMALAAQKQRKTGMRATPRRTKRAP